MLIEFCVENYRSIKDEARLSLVAGPMREHLDTNVVIPSLKEGGKVPPLVRSAAIYGPNASGKTNLVMGLAAMREAVLHSSSRQDPLPVTPFRLDATSRVQPTTFDVTIIVDGVRYQYGFSATSDAVSEEWLYAWPRGRLQTWVERSKTAAGEKFKFSDKLRGDKDVWRRATRPDALFLSTAAGLNSVQLKPLFDWFKTRLRVAGLGGWPGDYSFRWCLGPRKQELVDFMHVADLAVEDVVVEEGKFSTDMIAGAVPEAPMGIVQEMEGKTAYKVHVVHHSRDGQPIKMGFDDESDGTRKMFALAAPWLDSLEQGHVMVIDELHDNLHPALVKFLVSQINNPDANVGGAQLVFTTHDTSILSQDVFRRDQIWFCERNQHHETALFPLSKFHPRKGIENLERSYLAGRYGAVPYVRSLHGAGT